MKIYRNKFILYHYRSKLNEVDKAEVGNIFLDVATGVANEK
jgi:hypothetical protein